MRLRFAHPREHRGIDNARIGRVEPDEPGRLAIWQVSTQSECLGLADGATAPRQAAAATAATTAPAATSAAASAASATSAAAATSAATSGHLFTERRPEVLLVEDIERAEADVGDLLFGEGEPRTRRRVLRRNIGHRTGGCCRCAARQRQRHANDSQRRYDFLPALSLRSLLRHCHSRFLHEFQHMFAVAPSGRVGFAHLACKAAPLAGTHRRCAGFRPHEQQSLCNNRFHEHRMNDVVRFPPESPCPLRQPRADPHRNHC
jgi:hypothetical protein